MKRNVCTTMLVASLLLTACHTHQPLKTHSKHQSATFLMNASANVEQRLKFNERLDEYGYGYLECMEGKKNSEINCDALYRGMVAFAKEGHYFGFQSVTLNELTSHAVFDELSDDYYEVMAMTWPKYYPATPS